jgi:penicillin-binding protein 1C
MGEGSKQAAKWYRPSRRWMIGAGLLVVTLLLLRILPHAPLSSIAPTSAAIYARNGELMRLSLAPDDQYRIWAPISEIDPRLVEAVLLYEDRWFYWHPGVNPVAIGRALNSTLGSGVRQGASTISMQLARRMYGIRSQQPLGKLKQMAAALWLELRYSKREILEAYLNLAPYGGNIEGVATASLIYFHKRAIHLSLPEILTLAIIPQNPTKRGGMQRQTAANRYSSLPEPRDQARRRLAQLWLQEHPELQNYKNELKAPQRLYGTSNMPFLAPHATDYLLRSQRSGEIWSSIELRQQAALERIINQFIANHGGAGVNNASAMLIERQSGEVRALVGSSNYFGSAIDGQVNGTLAKRSPGSTLKPFIYALGMDQGLIHPMTMLKDAPARFGPFSPENFDGRFVGPISAQLALIRSRNVPAVALMAQLSKPSLYEFLQQAGVAKMASERHYGLALALGGGELTMEELGRLYLMLGNGGVLKPLSYTRTTSSADASGTSEDAGTQSGASRRLLSEEAAFLTLQMLQENPRPETGEPSRPAVAWKTGTSWGFRDAWTVGIFGRYVLLVWVGNFNGAGNPAFVGVQTAAPLFFRIVDGLRLQTPDASVPIARQAENVKRVDVCRASGDLPNAFCTDLVPTWFIPGKSPIKVSNLHRAVQIDSRTGQATCSQGPFTKTEIYEYWPTDMQKLFRDAGMPRRQPPAEIVCDQSDMRASGGGSVTITAPATSATYTLRLSKTAPIILSASAVNARQDLFWFANGGLIGKARAGDSINWLPATPGNYQIRVIDQDGRSDGREVAVEFVP